MVPQKRGEKVNNVISRVHRPVKFMETESKIEVSETGRGEGEIA